MKLTDQQILEIASDPATCPVMLWQLEDSVRVGDIQKSVLRFARAVLELERTASRAVQPHPPTHR